MGTANINMPDPMDDVEFFIKARASELIAAFYAEEKLRAQAKKDGIKISTLSARPKTDRKWRVRFKLELTSLQRKCERYRISPFPQELQELELLLYSGKKAVTPLQKNYVASCLAFQHGLDALNDAQINLVPCAADALVEAGGMRPLLKSPASGKNDLRQTVRPWMLDDGFIKNWKEKREKLKKFQARPDYDEIMRVAKEAASRKP